jgi:hypothetical protein
VRVLLVLVALLLAVLCLLLGHLFVAESETVAALLHLSDDTITPSETISMTLESARPEEVQAVKAGLKKFTPRTSGPMPRSRLNGFRSTYFDLEERALPSLTKSTLEAWFAAASLSPSATLADVPEEVLIQHAWRSNASTTTATVPHDGTTDNTDEDVDFFGMLAFLYPPSQQQRYYRTALNDILGFGTRVGGTNREPLLRHLLHEGLGRAYFNAEQRTYLNPAHLSKKGVELLAKSASAWPSAPNFTSASPDPDHPAAAADVDDNDRVAGWRWSLKWDNFSTAIPIAVAGQGGSSTVSLQNLVFQFPGGTQFRRKKAEVRSPKDVFVGQPAQPRRDTAKERVALFPEEFHPLDGTGEVYSQERLVGSGRDSQKKLYVPEMQRGVPGTKAEISTPGRAVPLKPSLSTQVAQPVSRQPVQHAVYAAHWDSMWRSDFRFLGACDSAVPMVYLLRTMRNIAVLTDVAEVLTASYREENSTGAVPGVTATFRESTTEAEVRARLATLLSPAHHALLYQYFFARPYTIGGDGFSVPSPEDASAINHPNEVEVDVRMWLDWVQHLPVLSFVFFDAEEAFLKWAGDDNTYGSRHLAQRWRATTTAAQTRYSGGPQSLFDTVDLFALYDLMGTAGTAFLNSYPTQSGIYYAALAQREAERRRRAFLDSSAITAELLWRVLGSVDHDKRGKAEAAAAATPTDVYVRQLGTSPDVALAALAQQHVTKVLANSWTRPSREVLPRSWLLYGTPHEMLTLHRISLQEFRTSYQGVGALASFRQYDSVAKDAVLRRDFDPYAYLASSNENIFFPPARVFLWRRRPTDDVLQDDQLHWLDTQRVLHLIAYPFPLSWHTVNDDGRDIHDGTTVDLANVLWSTVLELGHYWMEK